MFRILFLFVLLVPLIEVYLFVQVGRLIGALPTVLLCILMAFVGTWLFRLQGLQTVRRIQQKLNQHELPALDLVEAGILALAGLLMLIPGFFSDFIGLVCLIPAVRTRIAQLFVSRFAGRMVRPDQTVVIEGEYRVEEDKRLR